jgi:hypothetical protein
VGVSASERRLRPFGTPPLRSGRGFPTPWKWRARAETAGTTVNVAGLAIAALQLEATPAAARRRYMAVAG